MTGASKTTHFEVEINDHDVLLSLPRVLNLQLAEVSKKPFFYNSVPEILKGAQKKLQIGLKEVGTYQGTRHIELGAC